MSLRDRILAAGYDPLNERANRRTLVAIRDAGFDVNAVEQGELPGAPALIPPYVSGNDLVRSDFVLLVLRDRRHLLRQDQDFPKLVGPDSKVASTWNADHEKARTPHLPGLEVRVWRHLNLSVTKDDAQCSIA
jgi:hypothetical protein